MLYHVDDKMATQLRRSICKMNRACTNLNLDLQLEWIPIRNNTGISDVTYPFNYYFKLFLRSRGTMKDHSK